VKSRVNEKDVEPVDLSDELGKALSRASPCASRSREPEPVDERRLRVKFTPSPPHQRNSPYLRITVLEIRGIEGHRSL
jgi:hypothetical protein